ncbi:hypothetical protein OV208_16430 [Corallococcus sp. bb12-1]|nr:hypothetical protein [Corallococcus sp. bb12-1]
MSSSAPDGKELEALLLPLLDALPERDAWGFVLELGRVRRSLEVAFMTLRSSAGW